MPAGARVSAEQFKAKSGPERPVKLEFETVVEERPGDLSAHRLRETYTPDAATLLLVSETGAAGSAELRRTGRHKYARPGKGVVAVEDARFVVASRERLMPVAGTPDTDGSFSSAREAALRLADQDGRIDIQIVHKEELAREPEPA
jgi:hypothetical protein